MAESVIQHWAELLPRVWVQAHEQDPARTHPPPEEAR
jgi:hypothetical protein